MTLGFHLCALSTRLPLDWKRNAAAAAAAVKVRDYHTVHDPPSPLCCPQASVKVFPGVLPDGVIGTSILPGWTQMLNRSDSTLVTCTAAMCPAATLVTRQVCQGGSRLHKCVLAATVARLRMSSMLSLSVPHSPSGRSLLTHHAYTAWLCPTRTIAPLSGHRTMKGLHLWCPTRTIALLFVWTQMGEGSAQGVPQSGPSAPQGSMLPGTCSASQRAAHAGLHAAVRLPFVRTPFRANPSIRVAWYGVWGTVLSYPVAPCSYVRLSLSSRAGSPATVGTTSDLAYSVLWPCCNRWQCRSVRGCSLLCRCAARLHMRISIPLVGRVWASPHAIVLTRAIVHARQGRRRPRHASSDHIAATGARNLLLA